ncbi:hypothetical protein GMST_35190 [Geomonas silvestris]|uniref:Uncharacterized protein n=1 Tax=Geomonas silvestris TaxID=2740184 RepID=A0A6V8MMM7_9BACT|nr:hypothetical protein GMST_35190 [Geomonas silvestris]
MVHPGIWGTKSPSPLTGEGKGWVKLKKGEAATPPKLPVHRQSFIVKGFPVAAPSPAVASPAVASAGSGSGS